MKRINIDFKVEKNGKSVKVQSEESVPTKTSELENDSGFITQAPETAIDNQTITKNSANEIQTIGIKYNDNLITAEMIYNATHYIRYKEDEPTPPTPTPTKEAGLYVDGVLTKTWAQLLSDGDVTVKYQEIQVVNKNLAGDLVCDNVEGLISLGRTFELCTALTSIDASKLDTSNVINMNGIFTRCSSLIRLDLSNFDTSKVEDMNSMFSYCTKLTSLNLGNFDTSSVTRMNDMFDGCNGITSLDLSSFNTSGVTYMVAMFNSCTSLTNLDISNFTFNNVTNYTNMFQNVPADCEILVKSQTEKDWITSKFSNLTNVKIKGASTADNNIEDNLFGDN